MTTLHDAADQLARDIIANNLMGLMRAFTASGMKKALTVQAQTGGAQDATGYAIEERGDGVVHIIFTAPGGGGAIVTRWVASGDSWKVDDMSTLDT